MASCSTNCTVALGVGYINTSILNRSRCGLLTNALDVIRVVSDVNDVDVDEFQTDLLKLLLHVVGDASEEIVAVLVDLLDSH